EAVLRGDLEIGQPGRLDPVVSWLARAAGSPAHGGIDLRTGEFFYTSDGVLDAIELLLALKEDGSLFPGSNSLLAPQCRPRVARGQAGRRSAASATRPCARTRQRRSRTRGRRSPSRRWRSRRNT